MENMNRGRNLINEKKEEKEEKKTDNNKEDEEYKKASGFQTHQKSRLKRKFDRAEEIFND